MLDSLREVKLKNPVAVFDQNVEFHGKAILGIPVVGDVDAIWGWMAEGRLDSVVIAFNRDLRERKRVFDELRSKGARFLQCGGRYYRYSIARSYGRRQCDFGKFLFWRVY